jgi:hypothetical protein
MSAGGRFVLLISGLSIAAYVMSAGTGTDVPAPDPGQQADQASHPTSSGSLVVSQSEQPSYSFTEPTEVTVVERPVERSVALGQFVAPRGPDAIGRELQKELKRVGCYAGELNGVWTASTRQAMNAFTDRVNAKLPTNKPDSILLALVRGYSSKVCGIPCPSGQGLSRAQECTPIALLARTSATKLLAAPGQARESRAWTVKTTAASGAPPVQQAGIEHPIGDPGDVTPREPASSTAAPTLQEPAPHHVVKKRWQPPVRQEGSWADNFFKQRYILNLN